MTDSNATRIDSVINDVNNHMTVHNAITANKETSGIPSSLFISLLTLSQTLFLYSEVKDDCKNDFNKTISSTIPDICSEISNRPELADKITKMPFTSSVETKRVNTTIGQLFKDNANLMATDDKKRLFTALKMELEAPEQKLLTAHLSLLCITLGNLSAEFIDDKQDRINNCITSLDTGLKKHPEALSFLKDQLFIKTKMCDFLKSKKELLSVEQEKTLFTALKIEL